MRLLMTLLFVFIAPFCANAKLIIGIAGGTGSGKTTMADKLLRTFQDRAVLINQDNYYKDLTHMTEEMRAKQNFDHPDAIDFELLHTHLLQLKENKAIEMPIYDFCHHRRETHTNTVKPADIIVVEGILLFAVPKIRDLLDLKIFVETDDDIRLLRRMERDMQERARDFQSIRDQYTTTVKPMHDSFVEPSKRYADVIIPTLKRNENGVSLIISGINKDLGHQSILQ